MMYEVKTFYKPIRKADQSVVPKIFLKHISIFLDIVKFSYLTSSVNVLT